MMDAVSDADTAWIELRSRCTLSWIFDSLYRLADANTFRINRHGYSELEKHPFRIEGSADRGQFDVLGWPIGGEINSSPPRRVTFRIDGNRITIGQNIVVTHEWDAFEEKCHLRVSIDGKKDARQYTAAKVVQTALEPLFFG